MSGRTEIDPDVVHARRELIRQDARCEGCGATLAACRANQGKDKTAPAWFGCCARGVALNIPCSHVPDHAAFAALLDEVESGHVRTVAEVLADSKPDGAAEMFAQGEWWQRKTREWIRVADMSPGHRYNTAAMLLRDIGPWVAGTPLYRALTAGLTIHGDGRDPWQKNGRDPVTGEPCDVPPPMPRVCEIPDCGCSGTAHA